MLKRLILGLALLFTTLPASAQVPNLANGPAFTIPLPLYSGPYDPSQGQMYLNNLITSLNGTLGGMFSGAQSGSGNTNQIGFTASSGTTPVLITVSNIPGQTDNANAGIGIQTNGNGNITLFYEQAGRGVLAFGSSFEFQAANGVDKCPGSTGGSQYMMGNTGAVGTGTGGTTVTGFIPIQDWLGRTHKMVACG